MAKAWAQSRKKLSHSQAMMKMRCGNRVLWVTTPQRLLDSVILWSSYIISNLPDEYNHYFPVRISGWSS